MPARDRERKESEVSHSLTRCPSRVVAWRVNPAREVDQNVHPQAFCSIVENERREKEQRQKHARFRTRHDLRVQLVFLQVLGLSEPLAARDPIATALSADPASAFLFSADSGAVAAVSGPYRPLSG